MTACVYFIRHIWDITKKYNAPFLLISGTLSPSLISGPTGISQFTSGVWGEALLAFWFHTLILWSGWNKIQSTMKKRNITIYFCFSTRIQRVFVSCFCFCVLQTLLQANAEERGQQASGSNCGLPGVGLFPWGKPAVTKLIHLSPSIKSN